MTLRTGMAVLGVCLSGGAASAADLNAKDRAELLALRERVWYAWFGNDQKALEAVMPPETVTISAGQADWHDRAGVLESSRAFAASGRKLTRLAFPRTEIQAYGDTAFVYSLYEFDLEGPQGKSSAAGRATEIFVRKDGRWIHPGWHLDSGH